ncbi:homoserine kinase [Alteriqipengyuania lutimaris]|uniref:Homoserine kinase n=1 Tax=Alteriqipengyuania lutimaris TaxID=1538146 RepID=A0A395LKJ2_9SPHN|nr:homoserine kinase [Alteriqipengyuania lutimaris]MBB3033437.1 homoserine kinase type II [Alteriqipengyuania lutimaris]RDS77546.1 homoserine kinase [Alteriqipengyuania lutimaris]
MAVYTHLSAAEIEAFLSRYDVGALQSAKGIAEGISNSNWLVETERDGASHRYIFTIFEARTDPRDLPFFLALLDHLAGKDQPVPRTIHTRDGERMVEVRGKPAALIEFLPGVSIDQPGEDHAHAVGAALADLHGASSDFARSRTSALSTPACVDMLRAQEDRFAQIDPELTAILPDCGAAIIDAWPRDLPEGTIHADLFPDNVLFLQTSVTGLIDFYFACTGMLAYDLAVTHAAWCFDLADNSFRPEIGAALIAGYESRRELSSRERAALPVLAQGACLRFVATRVEDWFATPADGLVHRKPPMQFAHRLAFYREEGERAFRS